MRELGVWLGLLLFVLVLLYGGLNLAERGIAGIMASACRHEAFFIRNDSGEGPGITFTFAGWTARLYVDEICRFIDQWRDRLRDRPGAILQGKILDKTSAG